MSRSTILIIDDDQHWVNNIIKWLSTRYTIDIASGLNEAVRLLEQDNYVLIIISSLQTHALEIVQQRFPAKRLIVATNKPTPQEAIKMYDYGALDYFPKEFDKDVNSRTERAIKIPVGAT